MYIVSLLRESNTAIAATQMNKLNDIFCISLGWLNNAVLGKEIAVGLQLTEKIAFRVTRPMFSRVVWVPRNDLVETSSSSCLVIRRKAFGVAAIWLSVKMKFRQVFFCIGQFIKNCGNAAHRFQLASTSYWSNVFSSVVQTLLGSALRLL